MTVFIMKYKQVLLRFYGILNEFISPGKRGESFLHDYRGTVSVKDLVESVGVPHTEIDLLLVNGDSVGFTYRLKHEDKLSVFPAFYQIDTSSITKVRPPALKEMRFIVDVNMGKLARYLRLLGFDVLYTNTYSDFMLALVSNKQRRMLLTRDRELLKRKNIIYGAFIWNTQPLKQLREVVQRMHLQGQFHSFTRCTVCNGKLLEVDKASILGKLPEKTAKYYTEFKQCSRCQRIYWQGSHYQRMCDIVSALAKA